MNLFDFVVIMFVALLLVAVVMGSGVWVIQSFGKKCQDT